MTRQWTQHRGAQHSGAHAAHNSGRGSGLGRGVPARAGLRGAATPMLDLLAQDAAVAGGGDFFTTVLDVVGSEHLHLSARLALWQREQDRLLNRAWRRPGGLVRPAGL